MQKLLLVSILLATFALPGAVAARRADAGYASVLRPFGLCTAIYVLLLLFVYPRLF